MIFENVKEQNIFDNTSIFDDQKYELRVAACVTSAYETNYDAYIYSRHGGCHSEWWYQNRKNTNSNSIPIQVDIHSPQICENGIHIAVYVKCDNFSMTEISKELLRYIEGQTHIVCATHNIPMLSVFS